MIRRPLAAAAVLAACMLAPTAALAADGDDDPGFNDGNGAFTDAHGFAVGKPFTVVAPDGDVIAVTTFDENGRVIYIERRRADGSPETEFGDTPTRRTATGDARGGYVPRAGVARLFGDYDQVLDARILDDGELGILAANFKGGTTLLRVPTTNEPTAAEQPAPSSCDGGTSTAIDGRIRPDGGWDVLLTCDLNERVVRDAPSDLVQRIAEDGTVQGETEIPGSNLSSSPGAYTPRALALGSDLRIFVAGDVIAEDGQHPRVLVFDADGEQQDFAGEIPAVVEQAHVIGYDIEVDGQGRAIVGLATDQQPWVVARFLKAGGLDSSFGGDGFAAASGKNLGPSLDAVSVDLDDRVLVSGVAGDGSTVNRGGFDVVPNGAVIIRFTGNGELDPTFADGEGRLFVDEDPTCHRRAVLGNVAQEADGDIALAIHGQFCQRPSQRSFSPPEDGYVGLVSLRSTKPATPPVTTTTTTTTTSTTTTPTTESAPPPAKQAPPATVPSRACNSVRSFTVRLRTGRSKAERSPIVSAVVKVDGKRVKVRKGKRWTAKVNLKGLPKGRFTVSIVLKMADGGTARETRHYRTCVRGMSFHFPRLVTHPPKRH